MCGVVLTPRKHEVRTCLLVADSVVERPNDGGYPVRTTVGPRDRGDFTQCRRGRAGQPTRSWSLLAQARGSPPSDHRSPGPQAPAGPGRTPDLARLRRCHPHRPHRGSVRRAESGHAVMWRTRRKPSPWVAACRDVAGRRREILVLPTDDGRVVLVFPPGEVAALEPLQAGPLRDAVRAPDDPPHASSTGTPSRPCRPAPESPEQPLRMEATDGNSTHTRSATPPTPRRPPTRASAGRVCA